MGSNPAVVRFAATARPWFLGASLTLGVLATWSFWYPAELAEHHDWLDLLHGLATFVLLGLALVGGLLALLAFVHLQGSDHPGRRSLSGSILAFVLPTFLVIGHGAVGTTGTTDRMRRARFEALAERAQPLIDAIERYARDHGRAPARLDALVPDYLDAVPGTGDADYPRFEYETFEEEKDPSLSPPPAEGVGWELRVPCSLGFFDPWDVFFYWPTEDYPTYGRGGVIEEIGRWAYVHG